MKENFEITQIVDHLKKNPSECVLLIGATVKHQCGSQGELVRTEYVNNRFGLYFRFNGGPFQRPEPRFFLEAFNQGTLRFISLPEAITERVGKRPSDEKEKDAKNQIKKRLSLVNSKGLAVFPIPISLQKYVAKEIGWNYAPIGIGYKCTDEVSISDYMGTYFPRSFMEAYSLFSLLMQKEQICSNFLKDVQFSIIDIGSGTGGNLLGFLWALKDYCVVSGNSFPNVKVTSIEKNELALSIQEKLINEFFPNHVNFEKRLATFLSGESLLKDLTESTSFGGPADLIMCWKFICEFYDPMERFMENNGMYGTLLNIGDKHLAQNGILAICDVTRKAYDPDGSFLPCIMNREIRKILLSKSTDLVPILPLSCGHWHERCSGNVDCFIQKYFKVSHSALPSGLKQDGQGVFFKVFTRKSFSRDLMLDEKEPEGYIVGYTSRGVNICRNGVGERVAFVKDGSPRINSYPDAFEWSEKPTRI